MAEKIKTLHLKNCIARIHIPEMTEEQKKKQMDHIKEATAKFLAEVEAVKQNVTGDKTA